MTTPCTPTAPCAECADANVREQSQRLCLLCGHVKAIGDVSGLCAALVPICSDDYHGMRTCGCMCRFADDTKPHNSTCDHGHPCAMCVETAHAHNFIQINGQPVAQCACGNLLDLDDESAADANARHSRNQQDYDDDFKRRYHAYQQECAERLEIAQDTFVRDESETGNTWSEVESDGLQQRRTANTEFDDDWLMAPRERTRYVTTDDAFYWWWRGLQQGLALGVTQANADLQQMIEIAKDRL